MLFKDKKEGYILYLKLQDPFYLPVRACFSVRHTFSVKLNK